MPWAVNSTGVVTPDKTHVSPELEKAVNHAFQLPCEFIVTGECDDCGGHHPVGTCDRPAEWVAVIKFCPIGDVTHGVLETCQHFLCDQCKDELARGAYAIDTDYGTYKTQIIRAKRLCSTTQEV